MGDYETSARAGDWQTAFATLRKESLDNGYFPVRGISAGLSAEVVSDLFGGEGAKPFGIFALDCRLPLTLGRLSFIPQVYARAIVGENVPLAYANGIGGEIRGRYADQQLPFIGINNAAFRRNNLGIGRMDIRLRFGSNHYLSTVGNVCYDFEYFKGISEGELIWGAGLSYAYNTIVGPLKLTVHYSSLAQRVGAYFSVGFDF